MISLVTASGSGICGVIAFRKGYVALATHGRVALTLRMNGSDRM